MKITPSECVLYAVGLGIVLWVMQWQGQAPRQPIAPAPVKVELTPEVRYEIQKQVQREVRRLTKPVLPMVEVKR